MSKEKLKTIIIFVLVGIIILMIGVFVGTKISKKDMEEAPKEDSPKVEEKEEKEKSTDEVLASLVGEWGMCIGEYNCRGIIIDKSGDSYTYTPYIMWSEFGDVGVIKEIKKTQDDKYKLTVYYDGFEDEIGNFSPEQTLDYEINLKEIEDNNLYVGLEKYVRVSGDRETFFRSIMY